MTNSWSLLYDTMNDDVIKFDVGEDTIEFSSKTPWKYNEEEPVSYTHLTLPTIYSV